MSHRSSRFAPWCCAALLAASALAALPASGSPRTTATAAFNEPGCSAEASGPTIVGHIPAPDPTKLSLVSTGRFRCTSRKHLGAKVVLQGDVNGHWTALATVGKKLKMRAGNTYTLRTPPVACRADAQETKVRTYVELDTSPKNAGTNVGRTVTCV